ncbi:MAG: hypothetical protein L3J39_10080 [Verrucomicrobiales bacterium]|nr:hypothetical protein [Verrucomicrobiales bacterium]
MPRADIDRTFGASETFGNSGTFGASETFGASGTFGASETFGNSETAGALPRAVSTDLDFNHAPAVRPNGASYVSLGQRPRYIAQPLSSPERAI